MGKIKVIKKNDEFSSEYEIGDVFETTGTWYGGVHIEGKSGVPVSLDREEYEDLDVAETAEKKKNAGTSSLKRDIRTGDIVKHFKREWEPQESTKNLYKVLAVAEHTETGERLETEEN